MAWQWRDKSGYDYNMARASSTEQAIKVAKYEFSLRSGKISRLRLLCFLFTVTMHCFSEQHVVATFLIDMQNTECLYFINIYSRIDKLTCATSKCRNNGIPATITIRIYTSSFLKAPIISSTMPPVRISIIIK